MDIACMLVIDSTTSMGWIHRYLREHLARTISDFKVEGRTIEFGVMGFRDTKCSKHPWLEYNSFGGISSGADANWLDYLLEGRSRKRARKKSSPIWHPLSTEETLRRLRAKGGGNNSAESSLFAVRASLTLRWPESRRRIIAVFTDERPHVPDQLVESWDSINNDLDEAGIDQVHLFVKPNRQADYEGLTYSEVQILFHDLTTDMENLDSSFRDFVQTSSEWDDDDDDDIVSEDWDEEANPFDD